MSDGRLSRMVHGGKSKEDSHPNRIFVGAGIVGWKCLASRELYTKHHRCSNLSQAVDAEELVNILFLKRYETLFRTFSLARFIIFSRR